jgi:D-alanyl-D-alanine carboxypeptidase
MQPRIRFVQAALIALAAASQAAFAAQSATPAATPTEAQLSAAVAQKIDTAAAAVLEKTGVPSASVAVVRDGHIVYLKAYGSARLEPPTTAGTGVRYAVGSISKQFTATALLLLQDDGRLSVDDPVAKYFPDLTRAKDITLRQLLSHTAGYQDFWPQDYVMPMMLEPVTVGAILDRWARRPLDFEPGTRYQYSNTGYVIAGAIVEKVAGKPLMQFLGERVFTPLGMSSVRDFDHSPRAADATGYIRYALGPPRVAPDTGAGWMAGAGGLAMTAEDLAKWDIALINRQLLSERSYRDLETEVRLANGVGARYGLGLDVELKADRRVLSHGGEVSGFTALNTVYPDDRAAVVVLTNQDAARAADLVSTEIEKALFEASNQEDEARRAQAQAVLSGLQRGAIDRGLFTDNANAYFSEQALADFKSSLGPLGAAGEFTFVRRWLRGGMTGRSYSAKFGTKTLRVWTYELPDGRLEQFQVAVRE